MDTREVDRQAAQHATTISQLRSHPLRMLVVFGTPIAFATTGFLHLVPWRDDPVPGCRRPAQPTAEASGPPADVCMTDVAPSPQRGSAWCAACPPDSTSSA